MSKKEKSNKPVYRDASTGRFVDKGYANKHPKTTVYERNSGSLGSKKSPVGAKVTETVPVPERKNKDRRA